MRRACLALQRLALQCLKYHNSAQKTSIIKHRMTINCLIEFEIDIHQSIPILTPAITSKN